MSDINLLYKEFVIENSSKPLNNYVLKTANYKLTGLNSNCGDKITVFIQLNNTMIEKITFVGTACAVSVASSSIMVKILQKKTIRDAFDLCILLKKAIKDNKIKLDDNDLKLITIVKKFPSRIKCATLPWDIFLLLIKRLL